MRESATNMTATWPVGAPSTGIFATQPVEAAGARTDVHSQPLVPVVEMLVLWTGPSPVKELWL